MISLAQVYQGLTGQVAPARVGSQPVSPWVMNSQLVQPGGAFVARPGATEGSPDGHEFVGDALRRGARVVLAERARVDVTALGEGVQVVDLTDEVMPQAASLQPPVVFLVEDTMAAAQRLAAWWRGQALPDLKVVGITGSVGKTTVKELVSAVLSQRCRTWKSRGNYNSDIGLPLTLLDMPLDAECAVVEMGMTRPGEIAELAAIVRPQIGVVTNVGMAHAERLGTIEAIAEAKAELVDNLPVGGVAILNGDDPRVRAMAGRGAGRAFLYGLQPEFDLWADQIEGRGLDGIALRFHWGKESVFARLPLLGRHSVHAALAAAGVGLSLGMEWGEIIAGLKDLARLEVLRIMIAEGVNGSTIIDDSYNASPDSVMAALNLLGDMGGRRVAVLGDMLELGDYAPQAHRLVARRAANVARLFVAIGTHAGLMADEARIAGLPAEAVFASPNRREAIAWLRERLQSGDVVLVKGSRGLRLDEMVTQLSVSQEDV